MRMRVGVVAALIAPWALVGCGNAHDNDNDDDNDREPESAACAPTHHTLWTASDVPPRLLADTPDEAVLAWAAPVERDGEPAESAPPLELPGTPAEGDRQIVDVVLSGHDQSFVVDRHGQQWFVEGVMAPCAPDPEDCPTEIPRDLATDDAYVAILCATD